MVAYADWPYQSKISFNPDRTKQAQEILFSTKKNVYPPLFFSNSDIKLYSYGTYSRLLFNEYINGKIHQANKDVSLLQKLQTILPRTGLLTIYKLFIRPLLDYACDLWPIFQRIMFPKN